MSTLYSIFVGLIIICSYHDAAPGLKPQFQPCLRNQYQCPWEDKCVPTHLRCYNNTYKTLGCSDGSEKRESCSMHRCSEGEHRCGSGWCIPASWVCDGRTHCFDRSDEKGCAPVTDPICLRNQFRCWNGKCIRLLHRCDGKYDCSDQSDEEKCPPLFCPEGYHFCERRAMNDSQDYWYVDPGTKNCIPKSHLCNGEEDCLNKTDEKNCDKCENWGCSHNCNNTSDGPQCSCNEGYILEYREKKTCIKKDRPCLRNQFICQKDMGCVPISHRRLVCDSTVSNTKNKCLDGEHRCGNGWCIPASWVCDGTKDCLDELDENDCAPVTDPICLRNQFRCASGECIGMRGRCDGVASRLQCHDLSDEFECDENWCPEGYVRCDKKMDDGTKNCVPKSSFCDGEPECKDGWDEKDCDKCKNWGCSHFCDETLPWPLCLCKAGYELDVNDKRTCREIGET